MFRKSFEDQWTYMNDGNKRQLDYCLIGKRRLRMLTDAEANDDICIGVDHRSLLVQFRYALSTNSLNSWGHSKSTPNMKR